MAKVTGLNIPEENKEFFLRCVKAENLYDDGSYDPVISQKVIFGARSRNYRLKKAENLSEFGSDWLALSSAQKLAWGTAGAKNGLTGYQAFIKDTSIRRSLDYLGFSTPNDYYQCWYYLLEIEDDAVEFYLDQILDFPYYINTPNVGQKTARHWELMPDKVYPPVTIKFDYKSNMAYVDTPDFYEFYVIFYGYKDDVLSSDTFSFNLDLITDWKEFSEIVNPDLDYINSMQLSFAGYPVNGSLRFDNFFVEIAGSDYALNSFCDLTEFYWGAYEIGEFFEPVYEWSWDFDENHGSFNFVFNTA